jgi:hypothetical protein
MSIQGALSIALSVAAIALSAVLAFRDAPPLPAASPGAAHGLADAGTTAADAAPSTTELARDASALDLPEPVLAADVPAGGFHLADGTAIAPLDKGAPRHVRFGVVLVTYEGAEGAPEHGARRKSDALTQAQKLADEAKSDFHTTVQRGDSGSTDDVGEVARGVLEPTSEVVLFALPVGGVSGVIDTPRGFWIVKRLE